ncbi:UDP-N-acetylmuramoylalanine--D-glutamate ligase [Holospora obtusa F1]|uniref:UDP-N-acetylmuramoylalanine--D-glutamate ligase n=1 Tax=Holospora obtusa F1 TaxID=1399147 RepID=W6TEV2_HOLOB|nr:UDP-N-acetylmuramoyl-L-alanine--D-glutamate ligase [Holospora obtusa]ETZ07446.1 UDP-N-acetylmuramoylalanine--D-glutamate ligase [Holospora obtusa F1]
MTEKRFEIFVLGLGNSGMATAIFFQKQGIKVTGWDDCPVVRKKALDLGFPIIASPNPQSFLYVVVSPGISLVRLEPFFSQCPSENTVITCDLGLFLILFPTAKVLGITGTNGKSTTCSLIAHALHKQGVECRLAGNIGVPIFSVVDHDRKNLWYILEFSSYQLELCAHHDWRIEAGGLLNLNAHHLEYHGTMHAYGSAKCRILSHSRYALLDISEVHTKEIANKWKEKNLNYLSFLDEKTKREDPSCIYYNFKGIWWGKIFEKFPNEQRFSFPAFQQNLAMTYGMVYHVCGEVKNFVHNVKSFQDLPHRQHCFMIHRGIYCVDDSKATTPEACLQALMRWDCPIFWIAGGAKQRDNLSILLPVLSKITRAFLYGESADRFQEFLEKNEVSCQNFVTMKDATHQACSEALCYKEAVVLCSPGCPSFDQFLNFVQRGKAFQSDIHQFFQKNSWESSP